MEVVYANPGKVLRLQGALGPLQASGLAGSLTWIFTAAGDSTEVEMSYSVGGYHPENSEELAPIVDEVLCGQLPRLKAYVEGGNPELVQRGAKGRP